MGGLLESDELSREERNARFLRVSIESPTVKFAFSSDASTEHLAEIRKIIEALHAVQPAAGPQKDEQETLLDVLDDHTYYDLRSRLTDEFFYYPLLAERLRNALVLEEDIQVLKRTLPFKEHHDLDSGETARRVDANAVKTAISQLFGQLGNGKVRDCLVHIRGELSHEQQTVIMDAIKQRLGMDVQPRFFSTKKNLEGKLLIEAVCFGERLATKLEHD